MKIVDAIEIKLGRTVRLRHVSPLGEAVLRAAFAGGCQKTLWRIH
jgi:hypothetical protein